MDSTKHQFYVGCFSGKKMEKIFQWKKTLFQNIFPDGKKIFHGFSMEN
jgi:hypothetical protein